MASRSKISVNNFTSLFKEFLEIFPRFRAVLLLFRNVRTFRMVCRVQFELISSCRYVRNFYAGNRTQYRNGNILSETSVNPFSDARNISFRNTLAPRKRKLSFLGPFLSEFRLRELA